MPPINRLSQFARRNVVYLRLESRRFDNEPCGSQGHKNAACLPLPSTAKCDVVGLVFFINCKGGGELDFLK